MGLDITYLSEIRQVEEGADCFTVSIRPSRDFPRQADGLEEGLYTAGGAGSFAAGSYGLYNDFRNELAKLAGWSSARAAWAEEDGGRSAGPFWELINFSDCEGVIGSSTSAKLARDFGEYEARAKDLGREGFFAAFQLWKRAFEVASSSGAVVFH